MDAHHKSLVFLCSCLPPAVAKPMFCVYLLACFAVDVNEDILSVFKALYDVVRRHVVQGNDLNAYFNLIGGVLVHNDQITVSVDTPMPSSDFPVDEPICCDDSSSDFVTHMNALNDIICSQGTGMALGAKICVNIEGLYKDYCEINTIWYNTVNDLVRGMNSSAVEVSDESIKDHEKNEKKCEGDDKDVSARLGLSSDVGGTSVEEFMASND